MKAKTTTTRHNTTARRKTSTTTTSTTTTTRKATRMTTITSMTTTTGKKELLTVTSVGALISEFLQDETNVLNGEAWAAMYANVMEKYELSDLERIADELRSFDPAVQLPGVTGPWKVVKVPEYEKETNEGLRKSMLVRLVWLP